MQDAFVLQMNLRTVLSVIKSLSIADVGLVRTKGDQNKGLTAV